MIELLDVQAQQSGQEGSWLRLARWLRWTDSRPSPISALRRGLDALPQSKTLQEALAVQLADSGDSGGRDSSVYCAWPKWLRSGTSKSGDASVTSNSIAEMPMTVCAFFKLWPTSPRIGKLLLISLSRSK